VAFIAVNAAAAEDRMNLWQAAILGVVEGVTEYLPVSSTGHLIIASALMRLDRPEQTKRAVDAFNIVIQGGAILAVLGLYWPRIKQMLAGLLGRNAVGLRLFRNLVTAFVPAAVLGFLLDDWIERHLFYPGPVIAALALGGVLMIFIGRWQRRFFHGDERSEPSDARSFVDLEHLTWQRALIIGLLQCVAMWPGTSRSMMTIVGGMFVGMRPKHAAEFSFLLGLPTLGAACAYSALKNFTSAEPNMIELLGTGPIVVGIVVATISAAIAIAWLVGFLNRHDLALFGWYRLALCAVLGLLIWRGVVTITPEDDRPPTSITTQP
jgi:undecaprenyl-diphosphatase